MTAAIRSEFRKFLSTRMWWILALGMFAYLAFIGLVMAFSFAQASSMSQQDLADAAESGTVLPLGVDAAKMAYSVTSPLGYVFPLIIGSLLFTNEFRHKTITPTLLVEPRRTLLVAAKLIVAAIFGLAIGLLATLGTVAGAAPILSLLGDGAYLGSGAVWELLGWSVVVMAIWTVLGVSIGGLLTNQVAAIIVIIGFTQFIEPIARVVASAVDWLEGIGAYLPGAAADAVLGTSFFGAMGEGDMLPRWAGALVLGIYIAVFAVGSRLITLRRDIG
ncbi:ABC transporter permease [Aeromicrobium sp. PE09-221]|uniref:ABC transporter permease n=1 Tax=Aeromicrobium sp. PE09-221 TaxID=1898043 RepID=UPI000B3E542C|nr:ABC transporter permease [Aeromicrobium sp. PE09-221]OUZ12789.1 ABC transporter permease [Aeromicrobium sp. PE09-221]